jgi:hypothetical protein
MLGRKERGNEIAKAYGGKVKLERLKVERLKVERK